MHTFVEALGDCVSALALYADDEIANVHAPIVFGYSMSGYVALALEAERPGTFSGIVTLGTKFAWTPDVATTESARLDPAAISKKLRSSRRYWKSVTRQAKGGTTYSRIRATYFVRSATLAY